MIEIAQYTPEFAPRWDEMVRASRNGTFLLQRGYMDYHADRFPDASLIALHKGKPVALLPACKGTEGVITSHAGLTYGGWILPQNHLDATRLLEVFGTAAEYLHSQGYRQLIYKPVPYVYTPRPSQEDLYVLWHMGGTLSHRLISSAIDLRAPWKFDMSKRQQVRKALAGGWIVGESDRLEDFYTLLCSCLAERHEAAPVHTLAELQLLMSRFPANIRLFTATAPDGELHAGCIVYDTGYVAHSQYAATSAAGRSNYLLTLLYHHLLTEVFPSRAYFDFGTSNEQQGRVLNSGLLAQKYALGATGVAYDTYTLNL